MSDETTIDQAQTDLEGDVSDATPEAQAAPRDERSTIEGLAWKMMGDRITDLEIRLAQTVRALRDLADLLTNAGPPTKNARATVRTVLGDDSASV